MSAVVNTKNLSDQVNDVKNALNDDNAKVRSLSTSVQGESLPPPALSEVGTALTPYVLTTMAAAGNTGQVSWASLISQPVLPGAHQPIRRKVVGSRSSTSTLASAYKNDRLWHVFIGRLDTR